MTMSAISPQDLQRLAGLQGYDLTLEIDAMARKYGMSPEQIEEMREREEDHGQPLAGERPIARLNTAHCQPACCHSASPACHCHQCPLPTEG